MTTLKICLVLSCLLSFRTVGMPRFDGATFFMGTEVVLGTKHGMWTIIQEVESKTYQDGKRKRKVLARCDCGTEKVVGLSSIKHGYHKSCGCTKRKKNFMYNTDIYRVWNVMKSRCYSPTRKATGRYEHRGIVVCEEWKNSFLSFHKWAINNGYAKGLQLDRKDNNGNYEPSNCRFVTSLVNNNNRQNTHFVEYNGERIALGLLLNSLDRKKDQNLISTRIFRGWDLQKALDTPARKIKKNNA